jgi:hypothetical protein
VNGACLALNGDLCMVHSERRTVNGAICRLGAICALQTVRGGKQMVVNGDVLR